MVPWNNEALEKGFLVVMVELKTGVLPSNRPLVLRFLELPGCSCGENVGGFPLKRGAFVPGFTALEMVLVRSFILVGMMYEERTRFLGGF